MLTVKVKKYQKNADGSHEPGCFTSRILEANVVHIHVIKPGELTEVAGESSNGDSFSFNITPRDAPRPDGFADCVDFGFEAYIENSAGATTEIVRF